MLTTLAWAATVLQLSIDGLHRVTQRGRSYELGGVDNAIKRLSMEQPFVLALLRHAATHLAQQQRRRRRPRPLRSVTIFVGPSKGADATRCASRRMSAAPRRPGLVERSSAAARPRRAPLWLLLRLSLQKFWKQ